MRPEEIKKILKAEPFEPVRVGLSDGRSVLMRHPDQVVVSERHIYIGLAHIERSGPLATPATSEAIARDWIWVNLLHLATIEPANGHGGKRARKSRRG